MDPMQKAAKEKSFILWIVASVALFCAPSFASSVRDLPAENRVEIFLLGGQNRTGQQAFDTANRVENYDSLRGVASESSVAPIRGVSHLHHAWPKYLGGPLKQDLVKLPKAVHDSFHSGLDKILPRQWGKSYYDDLGTAGRKQLELDLAAYTKAFDAKYGTNLWQSMLNNGFPGL